MSSTVNIALIGNPNCGKTTIFNNLTGSRQKIGNWPGVTVEKKSGDYQFNNKNICVTDLPGIYSLSPAPQNNSIDQEITNQFIKNNKTDLYINILDSTNLKRNLYLTIQLKELGLPVLIVLNMMDKVWLKKINIDLEQLSYILDCPVLAISSTQNTKNNTLNLKQFINNNIDNTLRSHKDIFKPQLNNSILNNLRINIKPNSDQKTFEYYDKLNNIILENINFNQNNNNYNQFGYTLQLLEAELDNNLTNVKNQIYDTYKEDSDIIIADLRYQLINSIYNLSVNAVNTTNSNNQTNKYNNNFTLDNIVLNKYLGIPIFLFILYSIFELSISLGEVLKPIFELNSQYVSESIIINLLNTLNLSPNLINTISLGLATGITTVAGFIPQITLMFILLTFLEDSGYMARAAFVMDRLMQSAGLPGKSFVPLIISFGCNVPAILSTRTLNSPRDRILTCLMSPFMSCSARLAIFIVFASAFFPEHQGLMVFLLYITGILVAILTGLLLKSTLLTSKPMPFILELPSYNIPTLRNIFTATWQRCKGFIIRAGKLIIPICLILQLANNIQINGHWVKNTSENNSAQSILAQTGKAITPILNPIGVTNDNWPATVGLITGSLAKEVVVGTMNTLYSSNNLDTPKDIDNHKNNLSFLDGLTDTFNLSLNNSKELLSNLFSSEHYKITNKEIDNSEFSSQAFMKLGEAFPTIWAAFAYCLFVLLYMPCLSTFSILMKEIGKNWAVASLIWSLDIAYATSATVYQVSNLYITPYKSLSIIGLIIISHIFIYKFLKSGKLNYYFDINTHYHGHTSRA